MHFFNECYLYVEPQWLGFIFSPTPCGYMLFWHCAITCTIEVCITAVINMMTLFAMRRQNARFVTIIYIYLLISQLAHKTNQTREAADAKERHLKEVRFF